VNQIRETETQRLFENDRGHYQERPPNKTLQPTIGASRFDNLQNWLARRSRLSVEPLAKRSRLSVAV
jgi:hypothetical protein